MWPFAEFMHSLTISARTCFEAVFEVASTRVGMNKYEMKSFTCVTRFLRDLVDRRSSKSKRRSCRNGRVPGTVNHHYLVHEARNQQIEICRVCFTLVEDGPTQIGHAASVECWSNRSISNRERYFSGSNMSLMGLIP